MYQRTIPRQVTRFKKKKKAKNIFIYLQKVQHLSYALLNQINDKRKKKGKIFYTIPLWPTEINYLCSEVTNNEKSNNLNLETHRNSDRVLLLFSLN